MSSFASSIVPFNSGKSYVVRELPVKQEEYRFTDGLGRTKEDRLFLEQYEEIFLAAASGDLATCKRLADAGFRDFSAVSYGKFGTSDGRSMNTSPLKIAEAKEHDKIVQLFQSFLKKENKQEAVGEKKFEEQ